MKFVEIRCTPDEIDHPECLLAKLSKKLSPDQADGARLIRRWIDARHRPPQFVLRYAIDQPLDHQILALDYQEVSHSQEVHIIGAGPAGYFAALTCLENNLKPIIWEQGKDVRSRRKDLRAIQQAHRVNPLSNYCFGEGGAGTYSDGKLYTRAKKRGDIDYILKVLVQHGAHPDIAIEAHPHIGSNKLPQIISAIRQTILDHGGEIHFNHQLTDIEVINGKLRSITVNGNMRVQTSYVILATGHSARDIYSLFHQHGWTIEAKPFAMGVRIEHPQSVIDHIQYGTAIRPAQLPAASYRLSCEIEHRGVFSFCMCPGGLIVPSATAPGEIVVNGMSLSRRDSAFANSGLVVSISPQDIGSTDDPMACLSFQKELEQMFFRAGDGSQRAPAQMLMDFMEGKTSTSLNDSSYIPGLYSTRLDELLPEYMVSAMKRGLKRFHQSMKGYIHPEAQLIGLESRTSAPIRITRHQDTLMHVDIEGLYPCGEGAGYAGGIMSAALDGRKVIEQIARTRLSS